MNFEMPVVTGLAPVEPHPKGAAGRFNGGWQQDEDNPEVYIVDTLKDPKKSVLGFSQDF